MFKRLENILAKYNELQEELSKEEVISDYNKVKELSKEQSDLEDVVSSYKEYKKIEQDLEDNKSLIDDPELGEMVKEEIPKLEEALENKKHEIEKLLVPKDENDDKNIIMEIRGAAGGDEANIFAGDLFRMYSYYAEKNGWTIDVYHSIEGTSGGYSQIEFNIKGKGVYSKLKYESGSHRVQRIPVTEAQGRVHTSTATVLVMPEVDDVNIEIKESDLKIDVYHSSGAGGQSVNTSNSAVRITHLPSKIVVTCQNERSQLKNKEQALKILKNRLYEKELEKQESFVSGLKQDDMSINFGSQIRSYFLEPYKLVKDHRTGFENSDPMKILDGYIMDLLEYNLKVLAKNNIKD